jgi:hypothetical protein
MNSVIRLPFGLIAKTSQPWLLAGVDFGLSLHFQSDLNLIEPLPVA